MVVDISKQVIMTAQKNEVWPDFEDGLQMQSAVNIAADYIITRDAKGFAPSPVRALSPKEFLQMLEDE